MQIFFKVKREWLCYLNVSVDFSRPNFYMVLNLHENLYQNYQWKGGYESPVAPNFALEIWSTFCFIDSNLKLAQNYWASLFQSVPFQIFKWHLGDLPFIYRISNRKSFLFRLLSHRTEPSGKGGKQFRWANIWDLSLFIEQDKIDKK